MNAELVIISAIHSLIPMYISVDNNLMYLLPCMLYPQV